MVKGVDGVTDTSSEYRLFNTFLPFDIVVKIISHLDQDNCLKCMEVCRAWYRLIPEYSYNVWSRIELTPLNHQHVVHNNRWRRLLGNHVKHVTIRYFQAEQEFYDTIQKLVELNCTEIEHLEIWSCHSTKRNYKRFLSLLKQLLSQQDGQNTTHQQQLEIYCGHPCKLPFLDTILEACPQVQKFSFTLLGSLQEDDDDDNTTLDPTLSLAPISSHRLTNLTYLSFKTTMDKQRILIPLLQRSPHLEFLLLGGGDDSEEDGALSLLDLTKFSVWCPKLVYLEINPDKVQIYGNTHYLHQQLTLNNNDHDGRPKEKGLRYFLVSEDEGFGPAQIGPLLKQHEGTLEYIGLEAYEGGTQTWAPVFQDLKLPQLHTLHCDGTLFDDKSMRALIREATSLQRLTIQGYDDEIHLNLTKLIKSCLQLKKLDFTQVRLSFDEDEALEDEDSTNDMISSSLSPEEHLSRYLDLNGSQLSDIKLEDVNGINDEFMQAVAHLSTLKSLEFVLDTDNVYTNDGVFEFLLKLQGTVIQVLDIYGIRHLSSPMCEAIANLKFLKRFRSGLWYGTQIVDGPALIKMVEKSESLTDIHLNHITVTGIEIDDQDREVDNENPLGICLTRQLNGFTVASLDFPDYYNIYITKN